MKFYKEDTVPDFDTIAQRISLHSIEKFWSVYEQLIGKSIIAADEKPITHEWQLFESIISFDHNKFVQSCHAKLDKYNKPIFDLVKLERISLIQGDEYGS